MPRGTYRTVSLINDAVLKERVYRSFYDFELGGNETDYILLHTNGKRARVIAESLSIEEGAVLVSLIESPEGVTPGDELDVFNAYRPSERTSEVKIYETDGEGSDGVTVDKFFVVGGTIQGPGTAGATGGNTIEFVLKRDTDYVIKFESKSSASTRALYKIVWSER